MTPNTSAEIIQRLWDGSVPIQILFALAETDLYLQARRMSYLPQLFGKMRKYFRLYEVSTSLSPKEPKEPTFWLSCNDTPVHWQYPIGLLYDIFGASKDARNRASSPKYLELVLHTDNYPFTEIIPLPNPNTNAKEAFMNLLKQSSYVLYGNAKLVMNLSASKSDELWLSVVENDWNLYNSVNSKLLVPSKFQRVPVKILLARTLAVLQAPVACASDIYLKRVLDETLPDSYHKHVYSAVIQGISMDHFLRMSGTDQPTVLKLWELFKHVDNFLHVIVW